MISHRVLTKVEAFCKGLVFDCHQCGQCVLRSTSFICPMRCPKGLRNGPCGGTINEMCEVYPDRKCIWVRIHKGHDYASLDPLPLLPSPNTELFFTSSYLNLFNKRDRQGRTPLAPLKRKAHKAEQPLRTASGLERKLKAGRFVKTCEIRAPRSGAFKAFRKKANIMRGRFDAVNTTAFLQGAPSLSSSYSSSELVRLGLEPIAQVTGRDHTKTTFVSELIQNQLHGVNNLLCITGDFYTASPKIRQVFDMDAALMLYEARYLAENERVHFNGQKLSPAPRPFLGAAINPFTTPEYVPIRRLKQKALAGADFIQTQLVLDAARFREFMRLYCAEGLDRELFLIAGIPVVISKNAAKMIPTIPGVHFPSEMARRLEQADDLDTVGVEVAKELIAEVHAMPGVSGVHLMMFGMDYTVLPDLAAFVDSLDPAAWQLDRLPA